MKKVGRFISLFFAVILLLLGIIFIAIIVLEPTSDSIANFFSLVFGIIFIFYSLKIFKKYYGNTNDFQESNVQCKNSFVEDEESSDDELIYNVLHQEPVIRINPKLHKIIIVKPDFERVELDFNQIESYSISLDEVTTVQKTFVSAMTTPVFSNVGTMNVKKIEKAEVTINTNDFSNPFVTCILYSGSKISKYTDIYKELQEQIKRTTAYFNLIEKYTQKEE